MKVIGIAAITIDGFIARHSIEKITWSKDLSLFKKQTLNHTIIMGSNTEKTFAAELEKRQSIVVHRDDNPKAILDKIKGEKCFIIGGGKTFLKFAEYLTHLYLTIHPLIFGEGIKLFQSLDKKITLEFEKQIPVLPDEGIIQFQFSIKH